MGFSSQGPFWPSVRAVLLLAEVSGVLGSDLASLQPGPGECSECQISDTMYLPRCATFSMSSPLCFLPGKCAACLYLHGNARMN